MLAEPSTFNACAPPPDSREVKLLTRHVPLLCPRHGSSLNQSPAGDALYCPGGCRFEVIGGIPRFVAAENYAQGFGLQWNAYRRTQLDSFTGTSISKDRLERCLGGNLDAVAGKSVLEAGCGAGRFTEVLLAAGAKVFACDLSEAVEANMANCGHHKNLFVCQADIGRLPVADGHFDVVLCLGVVQHTPDPEATIAALCRQVTPGGLLVFDHYTHGYPTTSVRARIRRYMLALSPAIAMRRCRVLVGGLWPLHRLMWWLSRLPGGNRLRRRFLDLSPVVDYHNAYPQLGPRLLRAWAHLDTHDTLTDRHKHLRSADELRVALDACGMVQVKTEYTGNGVEVRACRPMRTSGSSS